MASKVFFFCKSYSSFEMSKFIDHCCLPINGIIHLTLWHTTNEFFNLTASILPSPFLMLIASAYYYHHFHCILILVTLSQMQLKTVYNSSHQEYYNTQSPTDVPELQSFFLSMIEKNQMMHLVAATDPILKEYCFYY